MHRKYDLDWALDHIKRSDKRVDLFHFWGHVPDKSGRITEKCLSNWYPIQFKDADGNLFHHTEQYMMFYKAFLFGDEQKMDEIYNNTDPRRCKLLGRGVKNFDERVWESSAQTIVYRGNYLKFNQHPELKEFLIRTGDSILVEASPYDKIWGIGLAANDPRANNVSTWNGLNKLGFVLMEVRDSLNG